MPRIPAYRAILHVRNNRLLTLREKAEMTQEQVAEAINVSPATYSSLECLRTFPHSLKTGDWRPVALRLAAFWGRSRDYLFPASIIDGQVNRMVEEMEPKALDNLLRHMASLSGTPRAMAS